MRLLGVSDFDMRTYVAMAERNDHSRFPGLVRISLGIYNTPEEVAYATGAIRALLEHGPSARYVMHPPTGEYMPEDGPDLLDRSFSL
jgi:hypothetical protein